jgi:hypothetical protein
MVIGITTFKDISLELDIEKIKATPDIVLDIETSYNFQARYHEENKTVLLKITYYLIFIDLRSNEQLLHKIADFGCSITNDSSKYQNDERHITNVLETIYEKFWVDLQVTEPYLTNKIIKRPYVSPEFIDKILRLLIDCDFYDLDSLL